MSVPRFPRPRFGASPCGAIRGYHDDLRKFADKHRSEISAVSRNLHIGHVAPENTRGGLIANETHVRLDRQGSLAGGTANLQVQVNDVYRTPGKGTTLACLIVPAPIVRIARGHSEESVRTELARVMLRGMMDSSRSGQNYVVEMTPDLNTYVRDIIKEIERVASGNVERIHPDYQRYAALIQELSNS